MKKWFLEKFIDTIDGYAVDKVSNNHFTVSKEGKVYHIDKEDKNWQCDCPAFRFRGGKTCKHIELLMKADLIKPEKSRQPIEKMIPMKDAISPIISKYDPNWEIVGSYRRQKSTFKDVDILVNCSVDDFKKLAQELSDMPNYEPGIKGTELIRGIYHEGDLDIDLDINRVYTDAPAAMLLYRTGPACFSTGTQVLTPYGFKNIESLSEGDEVFAGDGTITKVVSKVRYSAEEIAEIDAVIPTRCTSDHRHFVGANDTGGKVFKEPHWIEPKNMNRWHGLCYPRLVFPETESITERESFLLGLYLADGYMPLRESRGESNRVSQNDVDYRTVITEGLSVFEIKISLHKEMIGKYLELFKSYSIPVHRYELGRGNEATIVIKDKSLQDMCFKYGKLTNKNHGYSKELSRECLGWRDSVKAELLKGFFLGDGTFEGVSSVTFINTNRQIIDTLWLVAKSLFYMSTIVREGNHRDNELSIYHFSIKGESGRMFIDSLGPIQSMKGSKFKNSKRRQIITLVGFNNVMVYTKVIGNKIKYEKSNEDVWDIQVEHYTHSYLVNGYIVHNTLNMFMRRVAMSKGWSLSEKGIIDHITGSKVNVPQSTEKEIFDALDIPYLTPEERERWDSILPISRIEAEIKRDMRDVYYGPSSIINKLADTLIRDSDTLKSKIAVSKAKNVEDAIVYYVKPYALQFAKYPYRGEMLAAYKKAFGEY